MPSSYVKVGPWVNGGAPALSAANLDTLETQADTALADALLAIAIDANLSAAAQAAIAASHTRAHDIDSATDHNAGTAGDLLYGGAAGVWAKLAKGTQYKRLTQGANYPEWQDEYAEIPIGLGNGSATISTGLLQWLSVEFSGTIVGWRALANSSGSIVVDVWKCSYANYNPGTHPVNGDSITAANEIKITASYKNVDTTLTGWAVAITAGDILAFNVDSCSGIEQVTIILKIKKGL